MSALQFIKVPFKESIKVDFTRTAATDKPVLLPGAMRNKSLKAISALKPAKGTGFTYFYLIVDYFKNDKGISEGHYLGFGKKPDVFKHLKKMMKGKGAKFFGAGDGKNVAVGEAYMDTDASGADVMYFKPDGACKMKIPAWNKAFKVIGKKYLKMACALAPADAVFAADPEMAAAAIEDTTTAAGVQQQAAPQQTAGATTGFDETQIKTLASTIKQDLQSTAGLIARIKAGESPTEDDKTLVQLLSNNIGSFKEMYSSAPQATQTQLQTFHTQVTQQEPNIAQLMQRLGIESRPSQASELDIDALLKMSDDLLAKSEKMRVSLNDELAVQENIEIPGGEAFISIVES